MKQTLLAFAALFIFAACEQTTNEEAETPHTAAKVAVAEDPAPGDPHSIDSFMIGKPYANSQIKQFRDNIYGQFPETYHTFNLSFMIDAIMLRNYLNSDPNITMLNIYLAEYTSNSKMTLVYIGAEDSLDHDGNPVIDTVNGYPYNVERPLYKEGDTKEYVLNNVYPCPTCDNRIQKLGNVHVN